MARDFNMKLIHRSAVRARRRLGTSMLDLLVSLTLLVAVISLVAPMAVRHGRLLTSHRHYRLALDELSNQMERLAGLNAEQLPAAVKELAPSAFITERLPGSELVGEVQPAEIGSRVTLKLRWNETGRRNKPVTMAAWVIPRPQPDSIEPGGTSP